MKIIDIIKSFQGLYPIKGEREKEGFKLITSFLEKEGIDFYVQDFKNSIPVGKSKLIVDGEEIKSMPSSFVSGEIVNDKPLISSIHVSGRIYSNPNINFNPFSDSISLATHYFSPSISISRKDVIKVINAEEVLGKVSINKENFVSRNILVGNIENPNKIVFSHYDTVLCGAIDNSSGTSVLLSVILENKNLLKESLFVFSGSEELSYDKPIYWGKGYRVFEEQFKDLLFSCKEVLVVDCVGFDRTSVIVDKNFAILAFPIKHFDEIFNKIKIISSDLRSINKLWRVYHTEEDLVSKGIIREEFLVDAKYKVLNILKK